MITRLGDEVLMQIRLRSEDVDGPTLAEMARVIIALISLIIELMTMVVVVASSMVQMWRWIRAWMGKIVGAVDVGLDVMEIVLVSGLYAIGIEI